MTYKESGKGLFKNTPAHRRAQVWGPQCSAASWAWLSRAGLSRAKRAVHSHHPLPHKPDDCATQPCPWAESTDSILTSQPPADEANASSEPALCATCSQGQPSSQQLPSCWPNRELSKLGNSKHSHAIRSGVKISQWPATSTMNKGW